MKYISIREFQLNANDYLKDLPITLTRYDKPVASVIPVNEIKPEVKPEIQSKVEKPQPEIQPEVQPEIQPNEFKTVNFGGRLWRVYPDGREEEIK